MDYGHRKIKLRSVIQTVTFLDGRGWKRLCSVVCSEAAPGSIVWFLYQGPLSPQVLHSRGLSDSFQVITALRSTIWGTLEGLLTAWSPNMFLENVHRITLVTETPVKSMSSPAVQFKLNFHLLLSQVNLRQMQGLVSIEFHVKNPT